MILKDKILQEDIKLLAEQHDWSELYNSSILITGATGLIGLQLVFLMLYLNETQNANILIYAQVRNEDKAKTIFTENKQLIFIVSDIRQPVQIREKIDYIIHGASVTQSRAFVDFPVETIDTAYIGTRNMLEFAKEKQVKSFVYLSSMEVFGITDTRLEEIKEEDYGYLDILIPRNCYPESKRICESLCVAFAKESNVPAKIARLTQTIGPGLDYHDSRVSGQLSRCVIENKDIVFRTEGKMKRSCLYTRDAISGILTVLMKGVVGQAYTLANKSTFCSIREVAEMIVSKIAKNQIQLLFDISNPDEYAQNLNLNLNLNTDKIEALGWHAEVDLEQIYYRTIESMKVRQNKNN